MEMEMGIIKTSLDHAIQSTEMMDKTIQMVGKVDAEIIERQISFEIGWIRRHLEIIKSEIDAKKVNVIGGPVPSGMLVDVPQEEALLANDTVAKMLGVSAYIVRKFVDNGDLIGIDICTTGNRVHMRYRRIDVERFMKSFSRKK